jgi:adenylate kinase
VKGLRVGITGSPATGKKTVGSSLALRLRVPFLNLNDVASQAGFVVPAIGEPRLDAKGFSRVAVRYLPEGGYVVSGVFLPEAIPDRLLDYVIVLRCNPLALSGRYDERRYPQAKKKENLTAEFLDACLGAALDAFGDKVREIDTTGKGLLKVVDEVEASLAGKKPVFGIVDWLSLVKGPEDLLRFMV